MGLASKLWFVRFANTLLTASCLLTLIHGLKAHAWTLRITLPYMRSPEALSSRVRTCVPHLPFPLRKTNPHSCSTRTSCGMMYIAPHCLPVLKFKPVLLAIHALFLHLSAVWEQGLETERRNATALEDQVLTLKAALQVKTAASSVIRVSTAMTEKGVWYNRRRRTGFFSFVASLYEVE